MLVCAALAAPATSGAYVVGVADQNPALFTEPHFEQLAPMRTRYITAIDSIFKERATVDAWMDAAQAADMEIVVAFNPPSTMRCPNIGRAKGCRPISAAAYRRPFRATLSRYTSLRRFLFL